MSVDNCKSICREIEESDYGANLTGSAIEHLRGCRQCQRFYDERLKLRQLVANLETVAAPADFDLRVRSRIANERVGRRAEFWSSNFTFGIPSVALASLVLLIGGVFALRTWNAPTSKTVAKQSGAPETNGPGPQREQPSSNGSAARPNPDRRDVATGSGGTSEVTQPDRKPKRNRPFRSAVASSKNGGRVATREFSSTLAPVIKKEDAVASLESPVFPIETSSQPLRLSLDYSGGISRTISVPALSFGSERVLVRGSSSLVKSSPKGAW